MADKIENGAQQDASKVAEIKGTAPPAENGFVLSGEQFDAIVVAVIGRLGASLAETVKVHVENAANEAFAAILAEPAIAEEARQRAVAAAEETARELAAAAEADRIAAAEAASAQAEQADRALRKVRKEAQSLHDKVLAKAVRHKAEAVQKDLPGVTALLTGASDASLQFSDGITFLPEHAIAVGVDNFTKVGGQGVYQRTVDFARDGEAGTARSVWLLIHDKSGHLHVRKADLGVGLPVGGGASSAIPAGHLAF